MSGKGGRPIEPWEESILEAFYSWKGGKGREEMEFGPFQGAVKGKGKAGQAEAPDNEDKAKEPQEGETGGSPADPRPPGPVPASGSRPEAMEETEEVLEEAPERTAKTTRPPDLHTHQRPRWRRRTP